MPGSDLFRFCLVASLVALHPAVAAAQQAPPAPAPDADPLRVWLSLGLGPGDMRGPSGTSFRGSVNASMKRAVVIFRKTGTIEGIDGHVDHAETSLLGGMRFGGKNLYVIPAAGFGGAHWHDDLCTAHISCTPEVAAQYDDKGAVFAYDVGFHANKLLAGLAANLTGVAGSPKRNLFAVVISLELGWFGK